jgi:hypothetical protein
MPTSRRRHAPGRLALCAALAALATPARAHAYVQYRTDAGALMSWRGTNCLPVVIYPRGFDQMPMEEVTSGARAPAASWSRAANACTYLDVSVMESDDAGPIVVPQPHAAIIFRTDRWCRVLDGGACSKDADDMRTYAGNALMLTTTFVSVKTGQILAGSTEVNALNATWADLVLHPGAAAQDLQNALTHELGHFIGLDHSCASAGTNPWPLDEHGARAPDCATPTTAALESTMYPSANPGDLAKRTLSTDDEAAVCGIYPAASDPGMCHATAMLLRPGGGCSCALGAAAGGGDETFSPLSGLAILISLAAASHRHRERSRSRRGLRQAIFLRSPPWS